LDGNGADECPLNLPMLVQANAVSAPIRINMHHAGCSALCVASLDRLTSARRRR